MGNVHTRYKFRKMCILRHPIEELVKRGERVEDEGVERCWGANKKLNPYDY